MASIVKRPSGYFVKFRVNGRQVWKKAGPRKRDAERFKAEIEQQLHSGTYQELPDITLDAFAEQFLKAKSARVREKTLASYKGHLSRRIIPYFTGHKLKSLRPVDIENFLAYLLEQDIAPATAAKYLRTLKTVLKWAVQWGYLVKNPAEFVPMPRIPKKEMDYLTPSEIERLIAATDERYRCLIMTACYTGLRQGEILGLQWGDIDFVNKRIYVRRTWQESRFYEPKSRHSRRAVAIPDTLVQELKIHQARQAVELATNACNLVFPSEKGTPLDRHNLLSRILWPALKLAGLRRIRFHDLRHSYAAALISSGKNIKWVQKQLGHSSIMVTMDTYGHLLPDTEKNAAARLEAIFNVKDTVVNS